jgi:hypothetical protein
MMVVMVVMVVVPSPPDPPYTPPSLLAHLRFIPTTNDLFVCENPCHKQTNSQKDKESNGRKKRS